jgi:hypothetical protein
MNLSDLNLPRMKGRFKWVWEELGVSTVEQFVEIATYEFLITCPNIGKRCVAALDAELERHGQKLRRVNVDTRLSVGG